MSTTAIPAELDATSWATIEPYFTELEERPVECAAAMEQWLLDRSELDAACSESRAKLYINMTCDTADADAAAAYAAFVENVEPQLDRASFRLDARQVTLAETHRLTGDRYTVLHRNTAAEVGLFRDENVPLKTELSRLDQRYDTVMGAMTVDFKGETRTLPQMAAFQEATDRGTREQAWRAVADRRVQDREAIDAIYDEQIALRDRVAKNAGFDSFVGYAFESMHRFDYTPADCRDFHDAVETVLMPFCEQLQTRRASELGLDVAELKPWDLSVDPRGREPLTPFRGGADLVAKSRRVFESLDPELHAMLARLGDGANTAGNQTGALLDLDSRPGKAPGGYQYMLDRTRLPFIFMNAAGLHRDVETMVHEAGHAFHSMLCIDEPLVSYRHSPIEFAEVASMSMELLSMPHWGCEGGFYEDAAALVRAQRKQLEGSLSTLPWIATIDAFQHWIYEHPAHSRAERTEAWNGLMERFGLRGYRVAWDSSTEIARDTAWQGQGHLFGVPFYYIEYGIAQLGALQLWTKSRREGEQAAIEAYKRALTLGGSQPLPELFGAADIEFRFTADVLETTRAEVERALEELPESD
ncbi:MAG: M3 family oligoendopeptidase [Planctomycetota bacterium]